MSIFTNVSDYLNWVSETIQTGAKEAGKTLGMSIAAALGVIMFISIIAAITLTISHFIRGRREDDQQPGFVQRAQKHTSDPDFLKKAREKQSDSDYSGKGGRSEPEFVRRAREQQKKGGN